MAAVAQLLQNITPSVLWLCKFTFPHPCPSIFLTIVTSFSEQQGRQPANNVDLPQRVMTVSQKSYNWTGGGRRAKHTERSIQSVTGGLSLCYQTVVAGAGVWQRKWQDCAPEVHLQLPGIFWSLEVRGWRCGSCFSSGAWFDEIPGQTP